jgi:hypothetical protein
MEGNSKSQAPNSNLEKLKVVIEHFEFLLEIEIWNLFLL